MPSAASFHGDRFNTLSRITLAEQGSSTWAQIALTGTFHSPVYGLITITKDDLRTMLRNYQNEHPLPPTELMLDYDHLSVEPKTPSDGEAAGWFKGLELRQDGNELWAQIDLTDEAADKVRKKKFRYISPEIARRYKSKRTGNDIGYTLRAAALTNRPFLEGMEPVALRLRDSTGRDDVAVRMADVSSLPYDERERRVREAIEAKYPPTVGADGSIDWASYTSTRFVFEDRVVFARGQRIFEQPYAFDDQLHVSFQGEAYEVIIGTTPVIELSDVGVEFVF